MAQSTTGKVAAGQSSTKLTVSLPDTPPLNSATPGCLLKTAVAIVSSGNHQCRAHILFDEGAQKS